MLKPAARTVGVAPSKPAPQSDTCTTATLVRGRVYFHRNVEFNIGVPVEVNAELATELAEIHEAIQDNDGEVYEKAFFHVQYNQPKPNKKATEAEKRPMRRLPVIPLRR